MPFHGPDPPFLEEFLAAADAAAQARPEVDHEAAREVFTEAATLLYNGLVLDELDEHDARAVVDGLCVDLVAADPGAAIRARSERVKVAGDDVHDPIAASDAYLMTATIFQL